MIDNEQWKIAVKNDPTPAETKLKSVLRQRRRYYIIGLNGTQHIVRRNDLRDYLRQLVNPPKNAP